ncbi:MAG: hypothetical protein ACE5JA_03995 [bacterium]
MKWSTLGIFLSLLLAGARADAGVIVSEVMANPRGKESGSGSPGDRNEYVELHNVDSVPVDVEGWVLWDGDAYDLIEAWSDTGLADPDVVIDTTFIGPGCFAVILDPEYTDLGDSTYQQPYDFPAGTVILTIGNTTIGDGLSTGDPLSLGTPDTAFIDTYGTPDDTTDSIPFNAGDGISIERIDPLMPDGEENWAPCKDSMGTPGGKNSVTGVLEGSLRQSGEMGLRLEARPNPFFKETTIVGEHGESAGIYDVAGTRVRSLGRLAGSREGEITWDGLDDGGAPAPPGVYFCVATRGRERGTLSMIKLR